MVFTKTPTLKALNNHGGQNEQSGWNFCSQQIKRRVVGRGKFYFAYFLKNHKMQTTKRSIKMNTYSALKHLLKT